jgi:lysophospholipase L1-like esterase
MTRAGVTAALAAFLVLAALAGCSSVAAPTPAPSADAPSASLAAPSATPAPVAAVDAFRLVTLGDSYTSGSGLRPQDSWPVQLVRTLGPAIPMTLSRNLAAQGHTSENVITDQLGAVPEIRPHVITIQVGANDTISPDIDLAEYRANIGTILDALLDEVPAERIFAVSTPDYTLTARGGDFGRREVQRAEIDEANAILAQETSNRGIALIDISSVSDRVTEDPTLVAPDGLYPSAKQYAGWVELIAPPIRAALEDGVS